MLYLIVFDDWQMICTATGEAPPMEEIRLDEDPINPRLMKKYAEIVASWPDEHPAKREVQQQLAYLQEPDTD